ncbi:unnamed protein product [Durusdinium trenchii]|uniref:Uncharacterized protein n=1 Tax=Durusdinium trenchii TaxID=1381693 RepID=A0ABP0PPQ4_9DINO
MKMVLVLIKSGDLKACVLENVKDECPEFDWGVVSLKAEQYMLAQQRTRVFLRGLRRTVGKGTVPEPLDPFGKKPLVDFLDPKLPSVDKSTLTDVMRQNLIDAMAAINKMMKKGDAVSSDIIVFPLDRAEGKVYVRRFSKNIVPTLTTTNKYLFLASLDLEMPEKDRKFFRFLSSTERMLLQWFDADTLYDCSDALRIKGAGNAYPVPLIIAVVAPLLMEIRPNLGTVPRSSTSLGAQDCSKFDEFMEVAKVKARLISQGNARRMASKRLKDLLSFLSSLSGLKDAPRSMEQQQRLVEGCLQDFVTGPKIEMTEGTEMVNWVTAASIPYWMREQVLRAVQDKVLADQTNQKEPAKGKRQPLQRNLHLFHYFTEEEWGVMRSETQGLNAKLQILKNRCQFIGLTCPTEPTYVLANVILHLAAHNGPPETFQIDTRKAFRVLRDVKTVIKSGSKKGQHSGLEVYPSDPKGLPDAIKQTAYCNAQPVACPLDIDTIESLAMSFPCRETHGDVRRAGHSGVSLRSSHRDDGLRDILCNALLDRFMGGSGGSQPEALTIFGNGQSFKKRGKQPLALEDGFVDGPEDKKCKTTVSPEVTEVIPEDGLPKAVEVEMELHCETNGSEKPKPRSVDDMALAIREHSMKFPGTKAAKPYHLEEATIYTCPNSQSWRVKKTGDKKDRAFSWKKEDPKSTWKRVVGYLEEIAN